MTHLILSSVPRKDTLKTPELNVNLTKFSLLTQSRSDQVPIFPMNEVIKKCIEQCKSRGSRLALPEGEDPRIQTAALEIRKQSIATPVLLGDIASINDTASKIKIDLSDIEIIDTTQPEPEHLSQILVGKKKKITTDNVAEFIRTPLYRSVAMLHSNEIDAMVAGAVLPTARVLEASFAVGPTHGIDTLSSFFIMALDNQTEGVADTVLFADCAINIDPTAVQLAEIAITTAHSAEKLLDAEPRVAMLSFSTHGSARHASVSKVSAAVELVRSKAPDIKIEGEVQVDAALSERVANTKLDNPGEVAGKANVLIFPDLNAGNIAYKLVQYCGGAQATGPILQGFAKPVCDLSRGASVEDIVSAAAVTVALGDD